MLGEKYISKKTSFIADFNNNNNNIDYRGSAAR